MKRLEDEPDILPPEIGTLVARQCVNLDVIDDQPSLDWMQKASKDGQERTFPRARWTHDSQEFPRPLGWGSFLDQKGAEIRVILAID